VTEETPTPKIDTSVPHSARIWNYWLGGTDNYPVDREAGDKYREVYPQIVDTARAGRRFITRAVRYLASEAGIRQFLTRALFRRSRSTPSAEWDGRRYRARRARRALGCGCHLPPLWVLSTIAMVLSTDRSVL